MYRLHNVLHILFGIMLADSQARSVQIRTFMRYVTAGYWNTTVEDNKVSTHFRRAVHRVSSYGEKTLLGNDFVSSTVPIEDVGTVRDFLSGYQLSYGLIHLVTAAPQDSLHLCHRL